VQVRKIKNNPSVLPMNFEYSIAFVVLTMGQTSSFRNLALRKSIIATTTTMKATTVPAL
jgi:hypothetical protein